LPLRFILGRAGSGKSFTCLSEIAGELEAAPAGHPLILLVPEQATEQHLQILSELAQRFSDRAFREALGACDNTNDAHRLFTDWGNHAANLHQPAV